MARKGQAISLDLLIGVSIFLLIFLNALGTVQLIGRTAHNKEIDFDIRNIAYGAKKSLLSTQGEPNNWHSGPVSEANVDSLGLESSPGVISIDKLMYLVNNCTNYSDYYNKTRDILGIRGPGYEMYGKVTYTPQSGILGAFPQIAYSYGNSNDGPKRGDISRHGIRAFLDSSELAYTNYFNDYHSMITDVNSYNVLIFEDPGSGILSGSEQSALLTWVNSGGKIIFTGHGNLLEDVFALRLIDEGDNITGTIQNLSGILKEVNKTDAIICRDGRKINATAAYSSLAKNSTSNNSIIGYRNFTNGVVFYFCDMLGNTTGTSFNHTNLRDIINFGGVGTFEFGIPPPSNITQRQVYFSMIQLENYGLAKMTFEVWKQ